MTPEWMTVAFLLVLLLVLALVWRYRMPRAGFKDVQVVYEDGEWCVYGIAHTGEKVLIDAYPQKTEALACAYKVAEQHKNEPRD